MRRLMTDGVSIAGTSSVSTELHDAKSQKNVLIHAAVITWYVMLFLSIFLARNYTTILAERATTVEQNASSTRD